MLTWSIPLLEVNQVRSVIFLSHSADPDESDNLVQKCMEYANRGLQREVEAMATASKPAISAPAFVCRVPNLPPLVDAEEALKAGSPPTLVTEARCVRYTPSKLLNGFFIACLKKEVSPRAPTRSTQLLFDVGRTRANWESVPWHPPSTNPSEGHQFSSATPTSIVPADHANSVGVLIESHVVFFACLCLASS